MRSALLVLLLPLLLGGCAGWLDLPRNEARSETASGSQQPEVVARPAGRPAGAPPLPARKPAAPTFRPPEQTPPDDVRALVGLTPKGVEDLLGRPAIEEVAPPARLWRYNGRGCVLTVFFYPQVEGEAYRALTYEVRSFGAESDDAQRCFADLVSDKTVALRR